ncbi:hypothetical protein CCR75_001156 [Bremia lactucae]|uniref:Uncharacterized protein n=1 Tax=Bremia lactucae TaxID=4779 RepID=A0A976FQ35_BRELC|nr:hypothetical protein CCR75_001156 [Bremia lactucae]
MALVASTFRRVVELPWNTLYFLHRAMQWNVTPPILIEVEKPGIWGYDLYTPCSTKDDYDDDTDVSVSYLNDGSDTEDEDEWSCSGSEAESDGFAFGRVDNVELWGDRWFWTIDHDDDTRSCSDLNDNLDINTAIYIVEKPVDYVMPTMDYNDYSSEAAIDIWIEKYGASRCQVHFVTVALDEPTSQDAFQSTCGISQRLFIAVL